MKIGCSVFQILFIYFGIVASPIFSQDRDSWQQPEKVMDVIGVKPGMTIGEVGAGRGYFTFRLARRVGDRGYIFANDIDKEALKSIDDRCEDEGIANIETILGEVDDPLFPKNSVDMIFMSFVYHLLEEPVEMMKNLKPAMKREATVVIIDPRKAKMNPTLEKKMILDPIARAGYNFICKETFLERASIYIFKQKDQNK